MFLSALIYFLPLIIFVVFLEILPISFGPWQLSLILLILLFLQVTAVIYCLRKLDSAKGFGKRFLVLYLGWLAAAFPGAFITSWTFAGVSMAVADGLVKGPQLFLNISIYSFFLLAMAHIIFLPWILFTLGMRTIFEKLAAKDEVR